MRKQTGFSLIELMTAMAILTVLVLISAPSAMEWMDNAKLSSSTRDVLSLIQESRMHAIKENSKAKIEFYDGTNTFLVKKMNRRKDEVEWKETKHELPAGMTLVASFSYGRDTLTFNSKGLPDSIGNIQITNSRGTTFKISVNIVGSTRIERVSE